MRHRSANKSVSRTGRPRRGPARLNAAMPPAATGPVVRAAIASLAHLAPPKRGPSHPASQCPKAGN